MSSKSHLDANSRGRKSKGIVEGLYKALAKGDSDKVTNLLAPDLEWWFHGPPNCNHMMRVLTGDSNGGHLAFPFKPRAVTPLDGGRWVVAEGWKGERAYWVHVWTVKEDGVITQFREYFNTWVTVRDLTNGKNGDILTSTITPSSVGGDTSTTTTMIWQSQIPCDRSSGNGNSMPGLLLAI